MTPEQKKLAYQRGKALGSKAAALLTPAWSDADFTVLANACRTAKMDPLDFMLVSTNEANLEPSARNPRTLSKWPIAVGLNQINQPAAVSMGLIPQGDDAAWKKLASDMVSMTPGQQVPISISYFANTARGKAGLPWPNAVQIYMANAGGGLSMLPSTDETVIYQGGTPEYDGNKGLDRGDKGSITVKDLRLVLEDMATTPIFNAAAFRYALPSLRAGFVAGWKDAQARLPTAFASVPAGLEPDFFKLAYLEGYDEGQRAPAGSTTTLPSYLK